MKESTKKLSILQIDQQRGQYVGISHSSIS